MSDIEEASQKQEKSEESEQLERESKSSESSDNSDVSESSFTNEEYDELVNGEVEDEPDEEADDEARNGMIYVDWNNLTSSALRKLSHELDESNCSELFDEELHELCGGIPVVWLLEKCEHIITGFFGAPKDGAEVMRSGSSITYLTRIIKLMEGSFLGNISA